MTENGMLDNFGTALKKHLAGLPTDQRQKIRERVERAAAKSAAYRRGKAAFLALLDEIDSESKG